MTQNFLPLGDFSSSIPLAHRLRPKVLSDFVGQEKLRPLIKAWSKSPHHLVLWGPPGCGKTTLVYILAETTGRKIFTLNAVTAGIPELRKMIAEIQDLKNLQGKESILFIDEIHRFNKAQQDALLPYLEHGDFLFFGATTEYPQTSLNRPLLSRLRPWQLVNLSETEIMDILKVALKEMSRPSLESFIAPIAKRVNGDARLALSILSNLSGFTIETLASSDSESILKEIFSLLRNYYKTGDRHYDIISAFIKSIRGSDPNAAILWLAIMLDGGEDPEFIARRLMILSSEDIGLANGQALQIAANAHYVVKTVGMPEARITLSHAVIYLSLSAKSNSAYLAINQAMSFVEKNSTISIPAHLSNQAWGSGYQYPHDDPRGWVEQNYFPPELLARPELRSELNFYRPKLVGNEQRLNEWRSSLKEK
ncbi:MAG: replication-associated recombination protein A [Bacteriovoracaceae bacterium]|nr:replication-associated recombination protein A [Bacteriovoracaceae bacterium]